MINFTRVETKEIDEERLFEEVRDYLFEQEVSNDICGYVDTVEDLPKDVQRLIFAKIGAMMIDYSGSEDF